MSSRNVLGIDLGTTALKAIALEREKGIVAQTDIPHELLSLQFSILLREAYLPD